MGTHEPKHAVRPHEQEPSNEGRAKNHKTERETREDENNEEAKHDEGNCLWGRYNVKHLTPP